MNKVELTCHCGAHKLVVEAMPADEHEIMFVWWTCLLGDWMTLGTRVCKAWEVLRYGGTVIDDILVTKPEEAHALVSLLNEWIEREEQARQESGEED